MLRAELRRTEQSLTGLSAGQSGVSGDATGMLQAKTTIVPEKFYKDITNYAWDQSEKFMKIYVSLDGLEGGFPKENVKTEFTQKSFRLLVENLHGKNYQCHVGFLWSKIIPAECYFKIKSDSILVMLRKVETGKTWAFVTEREGKDDKKRKEKFDTPKEDAAKDPSAGLMDLMKKMYDDGDDEMKRTIAKSWSESRNKTDLGAL